MLKSIYKMLTETLKLKPDMWTFVLLGVVAVAFLVALIAGLCAGEYKQVKSLMKSAVATPSTVVGCMKKMPAPIKSQYKRARLSNVKPSDYVTENDCVTVPYKRSLISKVWLVTLVATVICGVIAYCVAPFAVAAELAALVPSEETTLEALEEAMENTVWVESSTYLMPFMVFAVGGLLTLVGAIIGKVMLGGGIKLYAQFVGAIDGDQHAAPQAAPHQPQAAPQEQFGGFNAEQPAAEAAEPVMEAAEPVMEQPAYAEPVMEAAEPVVEQPAYAEPVVTEQESEEEIRRRAREEALAQARAAQEAAAQQAAAQQAAAQQAAIQAQAAAAAQAAAQQAAAQQAAAQQAAAAQAQPAQPAGSSSADEVIARIEQIDREGASRETMREVATQLQKERAKPENKTPEQQKRLNEALSKLLKAMSAASRK